MQYRFTRKRIRRTAMVLLMIWGIQILQPLSAWALTSGPSQPESNGFQPVGVSDMVDLFTGDFKYNIPLMDVDGYPINLSYQSGSGMDDEASWVGLGWSLNTGTINRQTRGLPDDMAGDAVVTEHRTKDKVTIGGRISAKVEVKGKFAAGSTGSLSFGIFSDSYTGIGAEFGANAGISFSLANSGALTSGLGIGVVSNTASGVDVSPYVSLSLRENAEAAKQSRAGLSTSLGYNSRSGLKNLTLGASYSNKEFGASSTLGGISFNTEPLMPRIQIPYSSTYGSFSFDGGPAAWLVFVGGGGTGYKSVRSVSTPVLTNPGYGFLYAERGKNLKNAVHDFTREKENPVIPELPNLALPVHLPDMFSYTSQMGSGQFRLYRGGTGVFADNEATDKASNISIGTDMGIGQYGHGGVTLFNQTNHTTTRKWQTQNNYLPKGNFQDEPVADPLREHVFFKVSGEMSMEDEALSAKLQNDAALAIKLNNKQAMASFRDKSPVFSGNIPVSTAIESDQRQARRTAISYLTAKEAKTAGLDSQIVTYAFNDSSTFNVPIGNTITGGTPIARDADYRKGHHISEITVTSDGGQRMVYGIPVYNIKQEEYSFAAGKKGERDSIAPGVFELPVSGSNIVHNKGIDEYYHKESQPAYASSFLLTSILSPDYVDKTGNGITKDDLGTAIKFNYSRIPSYKWRTPYPTTAGTGTAQLNKGLLADPDDDKGSLIYGEKELYYIHTIESKTQIAYFITTERLDGLGVDNFLGGRNTTVRQRKLTEIRLYSKADTSRPIKVVKFQYSYELCPGTPNSLGGGKLTLKKVWFEYGKTTKGQYHSYKFTYNTTGAGDVTAGYATLATDRWGTYKPFGTNPGAMTNEEYPYSQQDAAAADKNAAAWQLSSIALPTGGIIDITYESDDYAYVQNRRAMQMQTIDGLAGSAAPDDLDGSTGINLTLDSLPPVSVTTPPAVLQWFKDTYLNGSDHMYVKSWVKLANGPVALHDNQEWDFVSAYCKVNAVSFTGNTATIGFEPQQDGGVSAMPVYFAAWQKLKNEYPRYAYPGFMNRAKSGDAGKQLKAAVSAIVNAVKNLSELKENFYKKASRKKLARYIKTNRTFVRISNPAVNKLGGGARVKKIRIRDNWQDMTGNQDAPAGSYGQSYEYTRFENGRRISSGVASYEPSVGNDENAMKKAIPYVQKVKGALSNFFEMEEPFGESFFPSPSVGYSQVTVRDLDSDGNEQESPRTGRIVHEFYTAREFPVKVTVLPLQRNMSRPSFKYSLVVTNSVDELIMSQGYSIEVNDMHGKTRAMRVFNQSGAEISSTEYQYNVENPGAEELKLKNAVDVIRPDGTIKSNTVLGRHIEFFTDFREQESRNSGQTVNIGVDIIPAFLFPVPIPHWPVNANNEYKLFRSASAVKVVQSYGLLKRVIKNENGSSIATENVAYDGITGEALITRTQNEFRQWVYSLNMPAYWMYSGMDGAYKNLGILLKDFSTNASAVPAYTASLHAGDELTDISNGTVYWVIENGGNKYVIDREGALVKNLNVTGYCKVTRSGYRNILSAPASTLVSLNNPIRNGRLQVTSSANLGEALRVISAAAMVYDEEWSTTDRCEQTPEIVTNNSYCFSFCTGSSNSTYGDYGSRIMETPGGSFTTYTSAAWGQVSCYEEEPPMLMAKSSGNSDTTGKGNAFKAMSVNALAIGYPSSCSRTSYTPTTSSYSCWPLIRSGIWICNNIPDNLDEWIGFEKCITLPTDKTYYFGYGADNGMRVYLDNVLLDSLDRYDANSYRYWTVKPYNLEAGTHTLRVEFINRYVPGVDNSNNGGAAGLEIYDNSYAELAAALDTGDLDILFSTASLRGVDVQSFRTISGNRVYHHVDAISGEPVNPCNNNNLRKVNPYLYGMLGNWRLSQNLVYQVNRKYENVFSDGQKGIGIKDAGFFTTFRSYWHSPANNGWSITGVVEWVAANTVTLYDRYGQELENRDALGRYSSALFDFNGEFPGAVASNAMNREIYANGFEDNRFMIASGDTCYSREFVNIYDQKIYTLTNPSQSHTGNYSVALPQTGLKLTTLVDSGAHKKVPGQYLTYNEGYNLLSVLGLYPKGFIPAPSKKYVFQAWVKDAEPTQKTVNVSLSYKVGGGSSTSVSLTCKAIVEGWKLIEGTINIGAVSGQIFELNLSANDPDMYLDDLRIFPYDAHMKSYAYNDKTMKLMAELDENAFATFYEYDDEGSLVRVKKETERGIVTLRETRSSYRKQ